MPIHLISATFSYICPCFDSIVNCRICRFCSVSAFDNGAGASVINVRPYQVAAELVIPLGDGLLCNRDAVPSPASGGSTGNWWSWGSSKKNIEAPPMKPYEGKLVFAKRGQCMFEDKAMNARALGAAGVIVYNNEVRESLSLSCDALRNCCADACRICFSLWPGSKGRGATKGHQVQTTQYSPLLW